MTLFTTDPAVLVLEDGTRHVGRAYGARGAHAGRGRLRHRHDRLPGDPHRPVATPDRSCCRRRRTSATPASTTRTPSPARIWVSGYVVRDPRASSSNWRADGVARRRTRSAHGIVGISGIDTRAVTRHLRASRAPCAAGIFSGRMPRRSARGAAATSCAQAPQMAGPNLSARGIRLASPRSRRPRDKPVGNLAVLDLGVKQLDDRQPGGARLRGARAPAERDHRGHRCAIDPVAVFYSNGPGDPAASDDHVELLRAVLDEARCRSSGSASATSCSAGRWARPAYKLPFGHRGINQPVARARHRDASRSPRTTTVSPSTRPSGDRLRVARRATAASR